MNYKPDPRDVMYRVSGNGQVLKRTYCDENGDITKEDLGFSDSRGIPAAMAIKQRCYHTLTPGTAYARSLHGKACRAGRTEILRKLSWGIPIQHRDCNSLYPYVSQEVYLPKSCVHKPDISRCGWTDVTVQIDDIWLPVLPVEMGGKRDIFFPVGLISGVFYNDEIRYAVQHGAKIIRQGRGCYYTRKVSLKHILAEYYERKRKCSDDEVDYHAAKATLNFGLGFFDRRTPQIYYVLQGWESVLPEGCYPARDGECVEGDLGGTWRKYQRDVIDESNGIFAAAAAMARIELHAQILRLENAGIRSFYCDTDAIIFEDGKNIPENSCRISDKMGDWKNVCTGYAEVFSPKRYIEEDHISGEQRAVLAGLDVDFSAVQAGSVMVQDGPRKKVIFLRNSLPRRAENRAWNILEIPGLLRKYRGSV